MLEHTMLKFADHRSINVYDMQYFNVVIPRIEPKREPINLD